MLTPAADTHPTDGTLADRMTTRHNARVQVVLAVGVLNRTAAAVLDELLLIVDKGSLHGLPQAWYMNRRYQTQR